MQLSAEKQFLPVLFTAAKADIGREQVLSWEVAPTGNDYQRLFVLIDPKQNQSDNLFPLTERNESFRGNVHSLLFCSQLSIEKSRWWCYQWLLFFFWFKFLRYLFEDFVVLHRFWNGTGRIIWLNAMSTWKFIFICLLRLVSYVDNNWWSEVQCLWARIVLFDVKGNSQRPLSTRCANSTIPYVLFFPNIPFILLLLFSS